MPDFAWNFAPDSGTNGCGSNSDLLGVELECYIVMGGNSNWGENVPNGEKSLPEGTAYQVSTCFNYCECSTMFG